MPKDASKTEFFPKNIFSGDYSKNMWEAINKAKSKKELQHALYFICCRIQELESRLNSKVDKE